MSSSRRPYSSAELDGLLRERMKRRRVGRTRREMPRLNWRKVPDEYGIPVEFLRWICGRRPSSG